MERSSAVSTAGAGIFGARAVSLAIAAAGALFYALLGTGIGPHATEDAFGADIYDLYYLAILDGRFDLPVRVLRFEGHYAPDGTGYLYHGPAPLLTRFALGWAWPLPQVSMAHLSVWFWAAAGTACFHLALADIARRLWPEESRSRTLWAGLLALVVWFGSPGVLLAAGPSLYHETIALAYGVTGAFVLLWTRIALSGRPWGWTLAGLAICAALALHARPNVAVGLYLGAMIAIGLALWNDRRRAVLPALLAIAILGAGGAGYLGFNAMRFGSAMTVHGSYDASSVRYGPVFWGREEPDSPRASAFLEHGRFNVQRILPNLALYTVDMPAGYFLRSTSRAIEAAYRRATADLGYIRIGGPTVGMLWLWTGWIALSAAALFARNMPRRLVALLAATGGAALLTLSYGTVELRYRFDLWPALATLAALGLYAVVPRLSRPGGAPVVTALLSATMLAGLLVSGLTTYAYRDDFNTIYPPDAETTFYAHWSEEECREKGRDLDLSPDRLAQICATPSLGGRAD